MKVRRLITWGVIFATAVLGVVWATGCPSLIRPQIAEAQGEGVELTVYNQNVALVKDRRTMELTLGTNEVRFSDVAALIDATSVHFRSLTDPTGTAVLEQNYEYDIVGSSKLLRKYVDQEISLVTEDGTTYTGTLLSGADDIILQSDDGQVTVVKLASVREFSFPALPEGLITRPTLVWLLRAAEDGAHDVEVTYMTGGVNWRANYIVVLADDDESLDLAGWVTLDNRSGASYEDAKLKLVAGDIHRAGETGRVAIPAEYEAVLPTPAPQVAERAFFEYHLYEVQRPVTVKDNQTKQIEFASATGVPAEKFFVYDGSQMGYYGYRRPQTDPSYGTATNTKVMVMLEFKNGEDQGLGIPLPKGTVRVYKRDVDGSELLVGEDAIDHTPKDETVRLYVGDAFDIVGERVQTDFKKLGTYSVEESFEITLRNHKDEAVEVRVVEHMYRWSEWEIMQESAEHSKTDAQTIEYRLQVPANGEETVTYTVRYRW